MSKEYRVAYQKAYRIAHRQQRLLEYRLAHPKREKWKGAGYESREAWYNRNRKEQKNKYLMANKDKIRYRMHLKYRRTHPIPWFSTPEWLEHTPPQRVMLRRRYLTHVARIKNKKNLMTIFEEVSLYENALICPLCAIEMHDTINTPNQKTLDHKIPQVHGGQHSIQNSWIICRKCNRNRPRDGSDLYPNGFPKT